MARQRSGGRKASVPDPQEPEEGGPAATLSLHGHGAAVEGFLAAYGGGRLASGFLLSGMQGIGKATLAYHMARFLLAPAALRERAAAQGRLALTAESEAETAALGRLLAQVRHHSHGDLCLITRGVDAQSGKSRDEIVIADIRRLIEFFRHTAGGGGWRCAIIDGADDLNRNAANALLKILEEPPEKCLLLLVCHRPGRLMATLRSRCQRLDLAPLGLAEMQAVLAEQAPDLSPADRERLAHLGDGSPGRALMLGGALLGKEGEGKEGGDVFTAMTGALAGLAYDGGADPIALHALGERLGRPGGEAAFATFGLLLDWWLARAIRYRARGGAPPDIAAGDGELAVRLMGEGDLLAWIDAREEVRDLLAAAGAANLDRKQVLLSVFTRLAATAGTGSISRPSPRG